MKKLLIIVALAVGGLFISPSLHAQANGNPPSQTQGVIPMQTVVKVLKVAKDYFNVSLGSLISGYCSGSCKVEKVGVTSSGDGLYKVEFGGGLVIIGIEGGA